jgi:putative oxidoreductase
MHLLQTMQKMLDSTRAIDWLGPLALRLYLVPIFWVAGMNKIAGFENTVAWFGNPDWGLGLPFPEVMAFMATATEVAGAVMLLIGLGVRWICLPLMFTMVIAAVTAHWENGWQSISDLKSPFVTERVEGGIDRLNEAKDILKEHGDYNWLTENGGLAVINNGIEFAATYLIMLLVLFFIGGGRFVSLDYWIQRRFNANAAD